MQFTSDERAHYDSEQLVRISHSLLLRQHCETLHGYPIEDICITSLRFSYIVTGRVNTTIFREAIPKSSDFLTQTLIYNVQPVETTDNEPSDDDDSLPLATCCGCNAIGPIGNPCTASECEDSGNIYSDRLRSEITAAFSDQDTSEDNQSDDDDSLPLATCCGCNAIGPIGNPCTESECKDSGNIYSDRLRPARTTAISDQE